MQKVLVFAGAKQSGKSTSAKWVHGYQMQKAGVIKSFRIDEDCDLLITLPQGQECVLDIYRDDEEFIEFAMFNVWPYAKIYSFAEELKQSAIRIFGLDPQGFYGSDEDKNQLTHIKWENIANIIGVEKFQEVQKNLKEYLSYRELLQQFGTVCRQFYPDCWIHACWAKIQAEGFPLAIIDDCRYENEVDFSNLQGAKTVRLSLKPYDDNHSSERIHLVDKSKFFADIDNKNLTIDEKNAQLQTIVETI